MKQTTCVFDESPVVIERDGSQLLQETNAVCKKVDADNYLIDGHPIDFPVVVQDAGMLMNAFLVDARVAQEIIDDSGLRVLEIFPGKTLVQLLCVDYRQNELGDYNEAAIIFPVLSPGQSKPFPVFGSMLRMARGQLCNFVYRMPVDQAFTTHAGRFIWGFPKWMARIDIEINEQHASGTFSDEGELVYSISAKSGGKAKVKDQRAPSVAIRDGKAWKTYGTNNGSGLTFSLGGKAPDIGETHPLALQLRQLGLPKKPLFTLSMQHTNMYFDGPEAVDIGSPFKS